MQEGLDILNRGSESVARSQRIAAETGKFVKAEFLLISR